MQVGLEPDQCFYIANESRVRGKSRLDLTVDPPPDLALEIDLTSRTQTSAYCGLQVPEIWRYEQGSLQILVLQDQQYIEVDSSPTFSEIPIKSLLLESINRSMAEGRNKILKEFRAQIRLIQS